MAGAGNRPPEAGAGFDALREEVVDRGLCVRCGACIGICPAGAVSAGPRSYPALTGSCTNCGLCLRVCPGREVDFPNLHQGLFGTQYDPRELHGSFERLFIGYAADERTRAAGSSGGLVTALLADLLRSGRVRGAFVCGPSRTPPWGSEARMARTPEEVIAGAQSRLAVVPVLSLLSAMAREEGPFAVAALPCQVHALRKLELHAPGLAGKIAFIAGLYCHFNLELEAMSDLLRIHGIPPRDVARVEYRGGPWPGAMRAVLRDGRFRPLHSTGYKEAVTVLLRLYSPPRCHLCIDPSNELADIGVGDVWAQDFAGEWAVVKSSLVTQRTARGREVLERAAANGSVVLKELPAERFSRRHLSFFREKKENAAIRILRRRRRGRPVPDYGFPLVAPPARARRAELLFRLSLLARRGEGLRRAALRLYLSPLGAALARLNLLRKNFFADFRHR